MNSKQKKYMLGIGLAVVVLGMGIGGYMVCKPSKQTDSKSAEAGCNSPTLEDGAQEGTASSETQEPKKTEDKETDSNRDLAAQSPTESPSEEGTDHAGAQESTTQTGSGNAPSTGETTPEGETRVDANGQLVDADGKAIATYEEWLAAAVVTGISMQYVDETIQVGDIYLCSDTKVNQAAKSKGVYVTCTIGGKKTVIQSVPLTKERTQAGTMDLSTLELGMATFDPVSVSEQVLSNYKKVDLQQLHTLIAQSTLVSIYEH